MARIKQGAAVVEAAEKWKRECLIEDGSILSDKRLWTAENFAHLERFYVNNLDEGEGDFFQKLEGQLMAAPPPARQLAAEMFWFMYLFVASAGMKAGTKRLQIRRIWEWSGEKLPEVIGALAEPLEHGIGRTGAAFNTLRWRELLFFVVMMKEWKRLSPDQRASLAGDPWSFGAWIDDLESSKGRQLRDILLYLVFPDSYDRMATGAHKLKVLKAFSDEIGGTEVDWSVVSRLELDKKMLALRQTLEAETSGIELDFYVSPFVEKWRQKPNKVGAVDEPSVPYQPEGNSEAWVKSRFGDSRIWAIAPGSRARAWQNFVDDGMAAIGWDYLGDLNDYETRDDVARAIMQHDGSDTQPTNSSLACWQFFADMKVGDYLIAKQGRTKLLGYGKVTSDYVHDEDRSEFRNVRRVEWEKIGDWRIPKERQITVKTLTEMTDYRQWVHFAFSVMDGETVFDETPEAPDHWLDDLFISPGTLDSILDTLRRKRNVVLEGPPGVGKTFAARRIAWALMDGKDRRRLELVQFHQSYSYEDFIQGWRPTAGGGFELRNGVFYRFCRKAAQDEGRPYVFVIDEINRANLSKVFGELMMLIEPDKRGPEFAIPLTYSEENSEPFYVPDNVFIIGAMNTADRSLALVDYALRRRFSFFRLKPAFLSPEYQNFLLAAGATEGVVTRLTAKISQLNAAIAADTQNLGPGFEIGHSYFCPTDDEDELDDTWYERVVKLEIKPLLMEYWFDQPEKAEEEVNRLLA